MIKKCNQYILEVYVHIHTKDEVSMNIYMDRRAYKKCCHLTIISWKEQRSNQNILGTYVYIHTKDEVSMTMACGYERKSEKNTKMAAICVRMTKKVITICIRGVWLYSYQR